MKAIDVTPGPCCVVAVKGWWEVQRGLTAEIGGFVGNKDAGIRARRAFSCLRLSRLCFRSNSHRAALKSEDPSHCSPPSKSASLSLHISPMSFPMTSDSDCNCRKIGSEMLLTVDI